MKNRFALIIVLFLSVQTGNAQGAQAWLSKKEWSGGLALVPHHVTNIQEFQRQYKLNQAYWDSAFAFMKRNDLVNMPKGKYPIDSTNVFATITEDPSKDYDKTTWESHKKYIDLQYIITGEEIIGMYPAAKATVIKEYDEKKDVMNYSADGALLRSAPGTFFLFFPADAHRPNITPGGNKVVKKLVIKIRYQE